MQRTKEGVKLYVSSEDLITRWLDEAEKYPHTLKLVLCGWVNNLEGRRSGLRPRNVESVDLYSVGGWFVFDLRLDS